MLDEAARGALVESDAGFWRCSFGGFGLLDLLVVLLYTSDFGEDRVVAGVDAV